MSLKAQPTIVTITKEDEAAIRKTLFKSHPLTPFIEAQFGKDQKTLEQTLGKQKASPLKFNQSKCKNNKSPSFSI